MFQSDESLIQTILCSFFRSHFKWLCLPIFLKPWGVPVILSTPEHPWIMQMRHVCTPRMHFVTPVGRTVFLFVWFFLQECVIYLAPAKKKKKKGAATQVGFCKNEKTFALHRRNPPRQLKKNVHLQRVDVWPASLSWMMLTTFTIT